MFIQQTKILRKNKTILKQSFYIQNRDHLKMNRTENFKESPMHALCAYARVRRDGGEKFQIVNGFYN